MYRCGDCHTPLRDIIKRDNEWLQGYCIECRERVLIPLLPHFTPSYEPIKKAP